MSKICSEKIQSCSPFLLFCGKEESKGLDLLRRLNNKLVARQPSLLNLVFNTNVNKTANFMFIESPENQMNCRTSLLRLRRFASEMGKIHDVN